MKTIKQNMKQQHPTNSEYTTFIIYCEGKREQSSIYRVLSDLFIVSIFVNIVDDEMRYKND